MAIHFKRIGLIGAALCLCLVSSTVSAQTPPPKPNLGHPDIIRDKNIKPQLDPRAQKPVPKEEAAKPVPHKAPPAPPQVVPEPKDPKAPQIVPVEHKPNLPVPPAPKPDAQHKPLPDPPKPPVNPAPPVAPKPQINPPPPVPAPKPDKPHKIHKPRVLNAEQKDCMVDRNACKQDCKDARKACGGKLHCEEGYRACRDNCNKTFACK